MQEAAAAAGLNDDAQDEAEPNDRQDLTAPETNLVKQIYEDQKFQRAKQDMESQIAQASEATTDSKQFLGEMDSFLRDLE